LPTDVASCLDVVAGFGPRVEWTAIGRAALGVLLVRVNAPDAEEQTVIAKLHQHVTAVNGTLVVLRESPGRHVPSPSGDPNLRAVRDAIKAPFHPNGVPPAFP